MVHQCMGCRGWSVTLLGKIHLANVCCPTLSDQKIGFWACADIAQLDRHVLFVEERFFAVMNEYCNGGRIIPNSRLDRTLQRTIGEWLHQLDFPEYSSVTPLR